MPNGKPGDHPLTDLLTYGHPAFGPPIDDLLIAIAKAGHRELLNVGPIAERLAQILPPWGPGTGGDANDALLEAMLREALAQIEGDEPRS